MIKLIFITLLQEKKAFWIQSLILNYLIMIKCKQDLI